MNRAIRFVCLVVAGFAFLTYFTYTRADEPRDRAQTQEQRLERTQVEDPRLQRPQGTNPAKNSSGPVAPKQELPKGSSGPVNPAVEAPN
jgi:hypothetical protein